MSDSSPAEHDFLSQLTALVEKNISNEQFGVSELAEEMNMSRSNLLRKVKKETELSVSQLISQIRLKKGMELLKTSSLNVSEVSHQVGFSSTSYFIKCFREFYGYPPGEAGKREPAEAKSKPVREFNPEKLAIKQKRISYGSVSLVLLAIVIGLFVYYKQGSLTSAPVEKSIAVLPFKNDSSDSTNVYLINGLMESTLNNLQKIKDLKVISRTSSEKYRGTPKSIPEIAKELNVNYFIEGSGQKMGDKILLNIQLIEGHTDKHLWARQYRRESKDIFALQQEIAKDIAQEIRAIITPDEENRIRKNPTDDLVAYDLFLKAEDLLVKGGDENGKKAISYFEKAIGQDPEFALAYASIANTYYYYDLFRKEKRFTNEITHYADKALLLDPKLTESLVAKAFSYMIKKEYTEAGPYLEKAIEYNPNSMLAINSLADYYCDYAPNTTKYLQYALKGVRLEKVQQDSVATSYNYLRLANALIQNGFVDESLLYMDKALEYFDKNYYARYIKAFIHYAKYGRLEQTRELLIKELNKDTLRIDILQDVAKVSYYMEDYESAYHYDQRFFKLREFLHLDIYKHEHLRMAFVQNKMGFKNESEELVKSYKDFLDHEHSIYQQMGLGMYYCYKGDYKQALEHMRLFAKEDNYQYWLVLFLDKEPMVAPIQNDPEFKKIISDIRVKFWKNHDKIKADLEDKGLL